MPRRRSKNASNLPAESKSPEEFAVGNDEAYEKFIAGLQLIGLGLKRSSSRLERAQLYSVMAEKTKGKRASTIFIQEYSVINSGDQAFDAEGEFTLIVAESEDSNPALHAECTFEVHMHSKSSFTRADAERFAKSELKLVLVPYARQFFTGLTGQMAIPQILLPLTTMPNKKPSR